MFDRSAVTMGIKLVDMIDRRGWETGRKAGRLTGRLAGSSFPPSLLMIDRRGRETDGGQGVLKRDRQTGTGRRTDGQTD